MTIKSGITAILLTYRRRQTLAEQVAAIRAQSVPPDQIWAWANEPSEELVQALAEAKLDRVVTCSDNAFFHGRFALALLAPTGKIALFDDDTIPGPRWFESCIETLHRYPGILGAAGVVLHGEGYNDRSVYGWQRPSVEVAQVDLVGHAWFMETETVRHLYAERPVTGTNGEDIELAARAWRLAGISCYCPPHPPDDQSRWGSIRGMELGCDAEASSLKPRHPAERDAIVRAEIAAGWRPLFLRGLTAGNGYLAANGHTGNGHAGRCHVRNGGTASCRENDTCWGNGHLPVADVVPIQRATLQNLIPAGTKRLLQVIVCCSDVDEPECSLPPLPANCAIETLTIDEFGEVHGFPGTSSDRFDCIFCDRALEMVDAFEQLLKRLLPRLAPDGVLLARTLNVRHHRRVAALLQGDWLQTEDDCGRDCLWWFTRRELEKLFDRAGFEVPEVTPVDGPMLQSWRQRGRPALVEAGAFRLATTRASDAEEFYAYEWFIAARPRPATPATRPLTSIVILTHNQLPYTRACLESIRFRTDEPYELIVVDNGSTDGTPDYLRSLPGVHLIDNAENRGFPAAANQGIRASRGEQVLLLNNDVICCTGWLRRLSAAMEEDPRIGLVGPCSNCVSGEQQVPVTYEENLADLDGFAWQWGRVNQGKRQETDRLVGFCLLIRRKLLDEIGTLDERFGIGNFEDDDLCLRTRQAGYRAVIARDAFIHHFGSRTFAGSGIDLGALLQANQQKFFEKWAPKNDALSSSKQIVPASKEASGEAALPSIRKEVTRSEQNGTWVAEEGKSATERVGCAVLCDPRSFEPDRQPAAGSHQTVSRELAKGRVSGCMIVRNNARTLEAALTSLRPWVDELIVVDTGSVDNTPEIARRCGATVYHFPWCDSFSAARNESLRYATCEFIFWMDSDDTIDEVNGRKLRALVEGPHAPGVFGYVMQVVCPTLRPDGSLGPGGLRDATVVDHVKLFRNHPDVRFEFHIHEQIIAAIRAVGGELAWSDIFVVHSGADHTPEGKKRKLARDMHLLDLDNRERPDHPFVLFNLGMTQADSGDHEAAVVSLRRSIEVSSGGETQVRKAYSLLTGSLTHLERYAEAWEVAYRGRVLFPKDAELAFRQGVVAQAMKEVGAAEEAFMAALRNDDERHFSSIDRGVTGYKARQNLAVLFADIGDFRQAEAQWRQIIADEPDYAIGWLGLGETLLRQDRHAEALQIATQCNGNPVLKATGQCLAAQVWWKQGEGERAIAQLRHTSEVCPNDPQPLEQLAQYLFTSGNLKDAEAPLMRQVELDPENSSAHFNLGLVYLMTGRSKLAVEPLQRSKELRPRHPMTWMHLGSALASCGRLDEARQAWLEVCRLEPSGFAAQSAVEAARRNGIELT